MNRLLYILFFALTLTACSTQKLVPVVEYHDRVQYDTIRQRDSIVHWHTKIVQGDTVYIHDSVDRWRDKEKIVEVLLHDSIPYKVEIEKEVRVRNGYDKFTARGFWSLLILVIAYIAIKILIKIYFKR